MANLTTQNATITTATIQIQALTIGRRQVTQSVFRQLPEESLLADDCSLNGEPWGTVAYHPDKCGDAARHLHVVWQRGDHLLRSAVYAPEMGQHVTAAAGQFVEASIAQRRTSWSSQSHELVSALSIGHPHYPGASAHVRFRYEGVRFFGEISPTAYRAARGDMPSWDQLQLEGRPPVEELLKQLPVLEYKNAWQVLAQLPQLFIAV